MSSNPTATTPARASQPRPVTRYSNTNAINACTWNKRAIHRAFRIPNLAGIVWYDVKEPTGDFRVGQSAATRTAFKNLATKLSKGCR